MTAPSVSARTKYLCNTRNSTTTGTLIRKVAAISAMALTRGAARLAGTDLPSFPDTETSFAQLIERTNKANAYVQGASSDAMDKRADTIINIPVGGGQELPMTCSAYLSSFVFPNLYFHAATAYNILRHNGVMLGKRDFLRPPGQ